MKEEFEAADVKLVKSSGGIFTVAVNGKEIFNNKNENVKFPGEEEIISEIQKND
ncbi:hypothetical protein ISALK_10480 [Isachenkonia alkalipeptolytica]|uniref:SelT/SelW/SelH family protein n=1 Tax=Isachenkonia alkalipeptolytica TaxID=2565777 RepID=A0AA43XN14_9CLOT|nr:hypothetical protein [Isachenkonia alkalipeptolytica]